MNEIIKNIMNNWEDSEAQKLAEKYVKEKVGIYDYDLLFRKFKKEVEKIGKFK